MTINPVEELQKVYNAKVAYGSATTDEEKKRQQAIADTARNTLASAGYSDLANKVSASGATADNVLKIIDNYSATAGKTKTRDYLYSLGQGYGMSNAEIDSLIGWDNNTGEISFGGKKVGRPDSVYDGVSYWSDTSALDNAFNDYIKRSGKAQPYEQAAKTSAAKGQGMTDDLYATQKSDRTGMTERYDKALSYADSDVTQSDEYKSAFKNIMPSYNIAAMQGRDNAVASGGASNGGNIDSYAAANAMRQQAAMTAKGQALAHQMGLEAYNSRVANVQNILSGLGGYLQNQDAGMQNTIRIAQNESQRLFENDQTEKNNKVDNLVKQSAVTGYVPKEWAYSNNPYFNSDGTLNDVYLSEDFDNTGGFTTIINNAKEKLKTTTNAAERANLEATINYATQAKAYKTFNNLKYAPYAHEVSAVIPDRTADYDLAQQQMASAERMALGENASAENIAAANNAMDYTIAAMNNASDYEIAAMKNKETSPWINESVVKAYQSKLDRGEDLTVEEEASLYDAGYDIRTSKVKDADGIETTEKTIVKRQVYASPEDFVIDLENQLSYSFDKNKNKQMIDEAKEKGLINDSQYNALYERYVA